MDNLFDLIIVAAVVWSVIGGLLGRKKGQTTPRAPAPRRPLPEEARPAPAPVRVEEPQSAAEMIPDDLWEILTGQKRRSTPPSSSEPSWPPEAEPEWASEWEAEADEEAVVAYPRPSDEARSLEEIPPPEKPLVVSLEMLPPPPAQRHAAFHERLGASTSGKIPEERRRVVPASRLGGHRSLQRAVILREVLGPAKGLEP